MLKAQSGEALGTKLTVLSLDRSVRLVFFFVLFLLVLGTKVVVISKKEFGIFISFSRFCNNLSSIGFSIP